jgi:hypothetical protein
MPAWGRSYMPFLISTYTQLLWMSGVMFVDSSGPAVHYDDDKAVRTMPWIEMVTKKKRRPDAFMSEYIRSGALMDKQK